MTNSHVEEKLTPYLHFVQTCMLVKFIHRIYLPTAQCCIENKLRTGKEK